ncbi:MAG: DUF2927 domain-containing protein [Alphaproteobacteria bacterium]|nr:DUF2927 domain-containing protein [Alphaproteobacteria bacterium]
MHRRQALQVILALAAALAWSAALGQQARPGGARQPEVQADRLATIQVLLQNFDAMAFGDAGDRNKWTAVQRWREPVRVVLIGERADEFREDVRAILAAFDLLTGIPFTLADGDGAANLRVFFSEREYYRTAVARSFPRPDQVVCFTNTSVEANGVIRAAHTVIPEDLSARAVRTCLAHELMHAIGFHGHPQRSFDSALRNGIGIERLTVNDRLLIRALYDSRLRLDMTPDEALAAATEVVGDLQPKVQAIAGPMADPMDVLAQRERPLTLPPWNGGPV